MGPGVAKKTIARSQPGDPGASATGAALCATSRSAMAVSSSSDAVIGTRAGFAALAEAVQMVREAEGPAGEGAAEVRDRGAPDEAGVVQSEVGFGLRAGNGR